MISFLLLLINFKIMHWVHKDRCIDCTTKFKFKFIKWIIEIIKYTYGSFTDIMFTSVTCVLIANKSVWKYDGTISCFNKLRVAILAFCAVYIVPFPLALVCGLILLKQKKISSVHFFMGFIVPLLFLLYWAVLIGKNNSCLSYGRRHCSSRFTNGLRY